MMCAWMGLHQDRSRIFDLLHSKLRFSDCTNDAHSSDDLKLQFELMLSPKLTSNRDDLKSPNIASIEKKFHTTPCNTSVEKGPARNAIKFISPAINRKRSNYSRESFETPVKRKNGAVERLDLSYEANPSVKRNDEKVMFELINHNEDRVAILACLDWTIKELICHVTKTEKVDEKYFLCEAYDHRIIPSELVVRDLDQESQYRICLE